MLLQMCSMYISLNLALYVLLCIYIHIYTIYMFVLYDSTCLHDLLYIMAMFYGYTFMLLLLQSP